MAEDGALPIRRESTAANPSRLRALTGADRERLRRAYETGRREYGDLPLAFETFAERVLGQHDSRQRRTGAEPTSGRLHETLSRSHVADSFLAIACEEAVDGAWRVLEERYGRRLEQLARQAGASHGEATEIARELPGELCSPPGQGQARTRLGTYDGTGSLLGWLKVILVRRVVDRRRTPRPESLDTGGAEHAASTEELRTKWSPGADPAEAAMEAELEERGRAAMESAWHTLTAQETVAVLAKYRDGLSQREITRLLGVGDSRVSRILDRATRRIGKAIRQRLESDDFPRFRAALASAIENHLANREKSTDYPGGESLRDKESLHE